MGLRIVFMGTPEFAVPALEKIHQSPHKIVGIVTQPDRIRARGKKVLPTAIKQYALDHNLSPIFQPEKMKDTSFVSELAKLEADVFVVIAFRILPEVVFTIPKIGCINCHPSLLPKYRGAAPMNWAIINGETETGITTMFLEKEIDAGNIILQRKFAIYPDETIGTLHDRFAPLGADMILESLDLIEANIAPKRTQNHAEATPARKFTKEMLKVDFSKSATEVKNRIHGLSPFPAAFTILDEKILKLYKATVVNENFHDFKPGQITFVNTHLLHVACGKGEIAITELQLAGKKRLKIEDFLRGNSIELHTVFS